MGQGAPRPRRHTLTGAPAWLLAAAVAVALTGCTADPETPTPTPTPVTSTTPAPTPTPTETVPTPPEKPSAWLDGTETGAIAAADYFMDLYNYVLATGDLEPWESISARSCGFCTSVAEDVSRAYSDGGHFEGGTVTTSNAALVGFDDQLHIHTVQFAYTTTEIREIAADGQVIDSSSPEDQWVVVDVGFTGSGWELVGADALTEPAA